MRSLRLLLFAPSALLLALPSPVTATEPLPWGEFRFHREGSFGFCPPADAVLEARVTFHEEAWPDHQFVLEMTVLDAERREVPLRPRLLTDDERDALFAASTRLFDAQKDEPDPFCPLDDTCLIDVFTWDFIRLSDYTCDVPRVTREEAREMIDLLESFRTEEVRLENGDANGDGARNVSDASRLLGWLFLGGAAPVEIECPEIVLHCPRPCEVRLENGDANGDGAVNIADASFLLGWLFLGGPEPEPICSCRGDCEIEFFREVVAALVGVREPEEVRALQSVVIERLRESFRLSGEGVEGSDCPAPGDVCDAYVLGLWTHEPAIALAVYNPDVIVALEDMEEIGEISPIREDEGS